MNTFLAFRGLVLGIVLTGATSAAAQLSPVSFGNFETPLVHPVALGMDGHTLAVCNLPDGRIELFDVSTGVPQPIGSIPVGIDPVSVRWRSTNELWVVNHISSTVNIIALDRLRVVATLETLWGASDVVFAGSPVRAFISCARADAVQVFDPVSRQAITNLTIEGDRPKAMAASPDGRRVYVAIFESGNASTILTPRHTFFDVAPESVVSHPDGPYAGQDPPPNDGLGYNPPIRPDLNKDLLPTGSLIVKKNAMGRWMDDNHGDWTEFVSGTNAALSGRPMGWDMPDRDLAVVDTTTYAITYASGLMNLCQATAVNPASGKIAVVGTDATNERRFEPNLRGTFLRVNLALVDPDTLDRTVVDLNPHLNYSVPSLPPSERDKSLGDPRGLVWNSAGTRAYVTGMGSRNLIVVDADGRRISSQPVELDEGPTGLALDEARARLYVLNRFSSTISVIDTAAMNVVTNIALFDPTPAAIKAGRKHLYDTRRNSGLGHVSCASCHPDGRFDRLAWDLGNPAGQMLQRATFPGSQAGAEFHPMKGPMVTQTLQDLRGFLHWRADRETLDDFNVTFTDLLGADAQLSTNEMREFKGFLRTLRFPPNRLRHFDNSMSTNLPLPGHFGVDQEGELDRTPLPNGNAENGRKIFAERSFHTGTDEPQRCDVCHNGTSGLGKEAGPFISLPRNQGLTFKGAQLRSLIDKIGMDRVGTSSRAGFGFLHDGRADTLTRFAADGLGLRGNDEKGLSANQEIADMVAFLLSFLGGGTQTGSDGDHVSLDSVAALGRQVTLAQARSDSRLVAMLALADSPDRGVDLVAHGEGRGWFFDRRSGRFQSDRNGEDRAVEALLARVAPTNEFTFTLVLEGSGPRAIDRDADGYFDQTEFEFGFDPLDPLSHGVNTPPRLNPVPPFFDSLPVLKTHSGLRVTTTNITATEVDFPVQRLAFSLTDEAPPGAAIDPVTGVFSWTPPPDEPAGERRITVRVTDDGVPPLDAVGRVSVFVVPLRAKHIQQGRTEVFILWEAVPGVRYAVQFKDRLDDPGWTNLASGISLLDTGEAATGDTPPASAPQRFYRIGTLE